MGSTDRKGQSAGNPQTKPLLFILSGPSGVGKDAVLNRMKETSFPLKYVVTVTTRTRRDTEIDGADYTFVSRDDFLKMIESGELLEWANVYGNMYGVPKKTVESALNEGCDVMVKVDVQGAATIKEKIPESVSIFLDIPRNEDLSDRLRNRKTESPEALELRNSTATIEMLEKQKFDYTVINKHGDIDSAVSEIKKIMDAEKAKLNMER
jgi:guanylate kinase